MSYRSKAKKFGRTKAQRNALIFSLCRSLIIHEKIQTTEAKAKAIRPVVEKMITRAKVDNLGNRRQILSKFANETRLINKLFNKLAPKYKDRNGGYTRIIKVEKTPGTSKTVAVIEFV